MEYSTLNEIWNNSLETPIVLKNVNDLYILLQRKTFNNWFIAYPLTTINDINIEGYLCNASIVIPGDLSIWSIL